MQLTHTATFDAGAAEVCTMLTDAGFRERSARATGVVETWTSPTRADLSVQTPGRPTEITGAITLEESAGGTTKTFTGEVKVEVPIIGGKLEALMADLVAQGMDTERDTGVAWLTERR